MDWNHYRFRCSWRLDAAPGAVYRVLERVDEYPAWWPQIRGVERTSETSGVLRMRSRLPYDLVVTARSLRQDPDTGVLEVGLRGDLDGWARWTVRDAAPGRESGTTVLDFTQEVVVTKPLMRALALPCRPLFRGNHALMMRAGERGLLRELSGVRNS